ncbi:MAG: UDP-glucose 4-epimerase GalE [Bacteroidetes bacterium]|jgi:UDP-glucose 4-epimerase|nr:UDP-glucose 4-epimerase GalE [Bacteroidota bacterium]
MKSILVTGGAGFIGSHTALELLNADYKVVVIDNLSNSKLTAISRVESLSSKKIDFYQMDLLNKNDLREVFNAYSFDAVIHFAALKAVGESVEEPLRYYRNNISGTINLCEIMQEAGVNNFVFSSSATVYGDPSQSPLTEDAELSAVNPYGQTKLTTEYLLKDVQNANPEWNVALLRYFNPVGAHESGEIGEDPSGIPNNLMPYVTQVAVGKRKKLSVFGNDYPTRDGTGERDYIHVVDLAIGHLKALKKLEENPGLVVYNLGTGSGYTVLELVKTFEKINKVSVPYEIAPRRPGDAASCYADPSKAEQELDWTTERGLEEMCRDAWNWQQKNPNGY